MNKIFIAAGEASGDLHAAHLLAALRRHQPDLQAFGLGGSELQALGCRLLFELRDLAVTGFWEVAKRLLHFRRVFKETIKAVEAEKPDLVLLVDYPGMNLRLARTLKQKGFPVVYYILPQVWAWKPRRSKTLENSCALLLAILPFEPELFDSSKVDCRFVGNPLLDLVNDAGGVSHAEKEEPGRDILALLPGSRSVEVAHHYATMLQAAKQLVNEFPELQVATLRRSELDAGLYESIEKQQGIAPAAWQGDRYDLLMSAKLAFVASGTATLETALCGCPFCVVYRTGWLSGMIARRVIKLKNVGLVNIVADKEIVPEYLQADFTSKRLTTFATKLLKDVIYRQTMAEDLRGIKGRLGKPGAARRAADIIWEKFVQ